ncbi:MAG: DUF2314 domain-containing protein [Arachnia sp.]
MGLFSKLFGKSGDSETPGDSDFDTLLDRLTSEAAGNAQRSFRYFWREVYWEGRRIVPALDLAIVMVTFSQRVDAKSEPLVERMWLSNIGFDGESVTGELINEPNAVTNIALGARVTRSVSEISDWLFACSGKTYGGFSVQAMRSQMNDRGRRQHDKGWGLDFGDPNNVLVAYDQEDSPENLTEHPMSKNMGPRVRQALRENPSELTAMDEDGLNILHREAIAGNATVVAVLLELGVDTAVRSTSGKTALDFARSMGWDHVVGLLS